MALLRLLLARAQQVPGRTLLTATDDLVVDLVVMYACNARTLDCCGRRGRHTPRLVCATRLLTVATRVPVCSVRHSPRSMVV